jgi:hypothetical protein
MRHQSESGPPCLPFGSERVQTTPSLFRDMRSRALRILFTLTVFAIVWLVVKPAHAAAPVCDPRGATMFAPPPQIQDAEQSLDVVPDCAVDSPLDVRAVGPRRGGPIAFSFSQEPMAANAILLPPMLVGDKLDAPRSSLVRPPRGVRSALERPPRR